MTKSDTSIVPMPPRAKTRGLQVPVPAPAESMDNLAKSNAGLQDMNFKMDLDFHRAFKATAGLRNMAMKELLEASFRCWIDTHGNEMEKQLLPPKSQG
jgi:hypothetical protein